MSLYIYSSYPALTLLPLPQMRPSSEAESNEAQVRAMVTPSQTPAGVLDSGRRTGIGGAPSLQTV